MTVRPVEASPRDAGATARMATTRPMRIQRLTLMLTEICNLDCFMCDFAKSKRLTKVLPLTPAEVVALLAHPVFESSLRTLTFTGGEPFAYPRILPLYQAIRDAYPSLRCNFSTNCTLPNKMFPVLDEVRRWDKAGMLVSIDGIEKHDEQRGKDGSFAKTIANLEAIRQRYPELSITIKFTITPINYGELQATYEYLSPRGYRFTVKMLEHNPHYTNKLTAGRGRDEFSFRPEQLAAIERQLKAIIAQAPAGANYARRQEMKDVLASLAPDWTRRSRCAAPTDVGFLDCDLNLFTCKEYPPVLNLGVDSLDRLTAQPQFHAICDHERHNTGKCTRCTSQMRRTPRAGEWLGFLASLVR